MKTDDFSAPAFMIGIMDGGAGKEVVDFFAGVSGFPEEVSLLKRPFSVRTGQEVVLELSKILRKEIPRRQHGVTSQFVIAEQKVPGRSLLRRNHCTICARMISICAALVE